VDNTEKPPYIFARLVIYESLKHLYLTFLLICWIEMVGWICTSVFYRK